MQYEYAYNIEGMVESKSASGKTLLSYTYDKNNNLKTIKDITGKSSIYSYDEVNRVKLIQDDNQNNLAIYDYNKNDSIKSVIVGNGLKTDYTYDGDGNVQSLVTISSTGEVLVDYNYAYDLNGNRLQKVSSKHKNFYTYDSMNRLKEASYDDRHERFTYDKIGNRLTKTTNDITEKYIYNVKNQLKELHNKNEINYFTYNKQGNTIKEETQNGSNIFEYNTLNQQVKAITKDGTTLVSRYDTEGLRAEIEENEKLTRFIFHKNNVLVEADKDYNAISRFTRGYEVVAADITDLNDEQDSEFGSNINRYYYTTDEQGSTLFITDRNRQVKNEYYYDVFGNVLDGNEEVHNRITYTGQQFDGITGQYYLRARFYNPVIGRFTQQDIYRGDGLNLYAYCKNNPVRYYDPSGYSSLNKERQLALPSGEIPLGLPAPGESSFNIGERMVSRQVYENYIKGQDSFRLGAPNADSFFFNKPGANTATRSFDAAVNAGFTPQNIADTVRWGDNELLRIRFKLDKIENITVPGVSKIPGGVGDGIIPGTNELFTGQGWTKNYLGERGFDEYIGSNARLIAINLIYPLFFQQDK